MQKPPHISIDVWQYGRSVWILQGIEALAKGPYIYPSSAPNIFCENSLIEVDFTRDLNVAADLNYIGHCLTHLTFVISDVCPIPTTIGDTTITPSTISSNSQPPRQAIIDPSFTPIISDRKRLAHPQGGAACIPMTRKYRPMWPHF